MRPPLPALCCALLTALSLSTAAPAQAQPTPTPLAPRIQPSPSPTLPAPPNTVDPARSIGGPKLAIAGTVVVDAPAGVPAPPAVQDAAWLIADADTGDILAAKNAHGYFSPASTMKVLTALTLINKFDRTQTYVATQDDANAGGTRVGLVPGLSYSVSQLFSALIMSSGNDAAYALANLNGGRMQTMTEMNVLAKRLGAHDTTIGDPSGLDVPGQHTSAYDLALFGRAAVHSARYTAYATTKQLKFPGNLDKKTNRRQTYVIGNHNKLLWNYPGAIGVKNGYTVASHRTFIGAATRAGKTYLVTELYSLDNSWHPPAELLDWAFAHGSQVTPVGRLVNIDEVPGPPPAVASVPTTAPTPSGAASPPVSEQTPTSYAAQSPPVVERATSSALLSAQAFVDRIPPWGGVAALATLLILVAALARRVQVSRRARRRAQVATPRRRPARTGRSG